MRLQGKIALITGAQQGIGRAVALAFAREGADVGINYLDDRSAAERLAQEIRAVGRRSVLVPGDVARSTTGQEIVAPLVRELGGVDVLVNNAGVYPRVPFLEMRERDWDLVLDVNLKGGFFCAQAAARAMIAGGRQGSIINLASQAIRGAVRGVHYSASKGGVVAMTRAMALELAPHRIRVNARSRAHRHRAAAVWQQRGRAGGHGARRTARPHGAAGRHRRRRGVSRE